MDIQVDFYRPEIEKSSGKGEQVSQSSPMMAKTSPLQMATTGEITVGESHTWHGLSIPVSKAEPPTFEIFAGLPQGASTSYVAALGSVGNSDYELLRPIPVCIEQVEGGEFVASFERADIAMAAETHKDALVALGTHILEVFEVLSAHEDSLGPRASRQFSVVKEFLRKRR